MNTNRILAFAVVMALATSSTKQQKPTTQGTGKLILLSGIALAGMALLAPNTLRDRAT